MKIINRVSVLLLIVFVAAINYSCSDDDSKLISLDYKNVSYGFVIDPSSITGVEATIVYMDPSNIKRGLDYMGNYEWQTTYTVPFGFSPVMTITMKKSRIDYLPSEFPAILKFNAGVVSGQFWSNLNPTIQFKTLEEFLSYFSDETKCKYTLSPDGPSNE